jgi:nicotinamide-nucleotide amidase
VLAFAGSRRKIISVTKAEIISVGTEMTSGQTLDTNSQWLSQRLAESGIPVGWHTTLADDLEDCVAAFRTASARAGLVLITGGLGPTLDDLTREALARLTGADLIFHQESFDFIRQLFERRQRTMPARNRVQALFPAGAEPLPNPRGTAPGIWMKIGNAVIAAMPGVPSEMVGMFNDQVLPRLQQLGLAGGVIVRRKINCFGAGESAVEEKLQDLTRRGHVPEVGITVHDAIISLRILARAPTREEAERQIWPVEQTIRERLGTLVYGVEEEELHDALLRLLAARKLTISTAESLTGGMVAQRICQVPGASAFFMGGVIAYDNRIKQELLDVPAEMLAQCGAVSSQVAEAMARGCRQRLKTDLAISTTGIAGPGGATPTKPVGLVFVGLAWNGGERSLQYNWLGTRQEIQSRTANMALNLARLHLEKTGAGAPA